MTLRFVSTQKPRHWLCGRKPVPLSLVAARLLAGYCSTFLNQALKDVGEPPRMATYVATII